jgi:micrococcal nuclease
MRRAVLLLLFLSACGTATSLPPAVGLPADVVAATRPAADAFPVTVVRVVDGDTLVARHSGAEVRVRLLGVDSPESVKPGTPVACFGHQASDFLRRLLPAGTVLRAAYEVEQHDAYGRELWDLWFGDGRLLQGVLAASGTVRPYPYKPNITYARPIAEAARAAHDARRGLWGACALTAAYPQLAKTSAG